jgi:hypothetical protein
LNQIAYFEVRVGQWVLFVEFGLSFYVSFQTTKKSEELSAGSCLQFMFFSGYEHGVTTGKQREIRARAREDKGVKERGDRHFFIKILSYLRELCKFSASTAVEVIL